MSLLVTLVCVKKKRNRAEEKKRNRAEENVITLSTLSMRDGQCSDLKTESAG